MPWLRLTLLLAMLSTLAMPFASCDDRTYTGFTGLLREPEAAGTILACMFGVILLASIARRFEVLRLPVEAASIVIAVVQFFALLGAVLFAHVEIGGDVAFLVTAGFGVVGVVGTARTGFPILRSAWRDRSLPWPAIIAVPSLLALSLFVEGEAALAIAAGTTFMALAFSLAGVHHRARILAVAAPMITIAGMFVVVFGDRPAVATLFGSLCCASAALSLLRRAMRAAEPVIVV